MAEQRTAERAAWEGELFRLLVENVQDYAIFVVDPEGLVRTWSHGAERLLGYREDEILGRSADLFFTPEDVRDDIPRLEMRAARESGRGEDDRWHVRKDGTRFWVSGVMTPLRDEGGELRGFAKIMRDRTEWWIAEQGRRESEERHRAILESITDAFFAVDRDWRFTYLNRQARRLLDPTSGGVIGLSMWEEYPGLAGSVFERAYRRAADERVATSVTSYYPDHDRWYEVHAYPSAEGLSVYFRDVTARKRSEEEHDRLVAASEQQRRTYETALSNSPDFNYIFDLEGRFTFVNAALLGLLRKGLDEAVGKDFFDLGYPSDLAARLHRQIRQVIETKRPVRDETPYTSHLGERQYEYIFGPVLGAGGAVEAVAGSTRDITERKRAEQRERLLLAETATANARFRAFFEQGPLFAGIMAVDGTIIEPNRLSLEGCGYTREEVVGKPFWECPWWSPSEALVERIRAASALAAAGETFRAEMPYFVADGDERMVDLILLPIKDEAGRVVFLAPIGTDITDRKRAEEQIRVAKEEAENANRAKTQFLAVLSHELRTPLNPILLAVTSMIDRPTPPEDVRPTMEMIRHNVNLQARLIDDLLDTMRIVQGKMPLHWGVADCHEVIKYAVQVCQSDVFGKTIRLTLDLAAEDHHVNADAARLQQVFWNLIKNAVKFSPEGRAIAFRTCNEGDPDQPGGRLVIEVSDTGIGIEPEALPHIFDPFQQGETSITRRFGGLGLGLAICKGVIDAHDGTIDARSEGKGRGTTFRIVLRSLPAPAIEGNGRRHAPDAAEAPTTPPASTRKILVVEDEEVTRRLMARLLRGLGHEVTTAGSIAEGIEATEAGAFDLIVSDIGLPDGSGLDLMRRVVARRGSVPSIALTGYGMEEDIVRSREAGFTAHMTKPIDFTKLEAMIRQVAV